MEKTLESYPLEFDHFADLYAPQNPPDISVKSPVQRLVDALERGKIAASAHNADDDGGTCNFDSPALDFKACGMKRADAETAIKAAGLHCFEWKPSRFGRDKLLVITGFQAGQANRHTETAEAFYHSMKSDGYPVTMYYQMD